MVLQDLIPKSRIARVIDPLGPSIDFLRRNLLTSTIALGAGVAGVVATAAVVRKKAKKTKAKKKVSSRRGRKKTKAEIKRARLRNLAKARRAPRKRKRIIQGPGLGRGEIKHSGKGTKGTKLVRFKTKSGKIVTFKVKGTSKRRRGFRK